jgi:hypothetical protein
MISRGRIAWRRAQARKHTQRLAQLRQRMIAAHPDKGGTVTRFNRARQAYLAARKAA